MPTLKLIFMVVANVFRICSVNNRAILFGRVSVVKRMGTFISETTSRHSNVGGKMGLGAAWGLF